MSYTTSSDNANNNAVTVPIPMANAVSISGIVSTPRQSNTVISREVQELKRALESTNEQLRNVETKNNQLSRQMNEMNEKFATNSTTINTKFRFPGTKDDLKILRCLVIDIEREQIGEDSWRLDETLIGGPYNGQKVKAIISNFEVHHTYFIVLKGRVWSSTDRANFVKYVLGKRFNKIRNEKRKKDLPEEAKKEELRKKNYATRKSQILKRRRSTYSNFKHRLEAYYGTDVECLSVLVPEMISDQEDELDADGEEVRSRKAPKYRTEKCNEFFDELDAIRNANTKARNRRFIPTKTGSRTRKESHAITSETLAALPTWAVDSSFV